MVKKKKDKKWNILAMARKSKYCMTPIVPDEGHVFISSDCQAAEPTILLNYSNDQTLYTILYNMRGKRPFRKNGLLYTDSLYVTTMSRTPLLAPTLERLGEDWLDLWVTDNDQAKKQLGSIYAICKMLVLALIYGLGKSSMARHLHEADVIMTKKEISDVYEGFWNSLPQAKQLRDYLAYEFKKAYEQGRCYVSPLGFPLPTADSHKGLNYCVQSGVSSWIRYMNQTLFANEHYKLVAIIHDELVVMVPESMIEAYKKDLYNAEKACNEHFGFQYPLKLGFNVARNFYEFKGA